MGNFRELVVWQKAEALAVEIYQLTNDIKLLARDYGLKDQMRRSAVSIASNIAEGDESGTNKQSIRYFNIAKGSSAELKTQLGIAYKIGYLEKPLFEKLFGLCEQISVMLFKLINARSKK